MVVSSRSTGAIQGGPPAFQNRRGGKGKATGGGEGRKRKEKEKTQEKFKSVYGNDNIVEKPLRSLL